MSNSTREAGQKGRYRLALKIFEALLLLTLVPWSIAAIWMAGGGAEGQLLWRALLLLVALGPSLFLTIRGRQRWRWLTLLFAGLVGTVFLSQFKASHDREWNEDQARLAQVERLGDEIVFRNVRDFDYQSETRWAPSWITVNLRLSELKKAYFVVEHFGGPEAIAHTMVSFEFSEDRFLVVSVEIRKEQGESYNPIAGLFRRYELAYVLATESDAVKLRTHHRSSRVHIHPIDVSQERLQAYFLDVVERIDGLSRTPEFYNTLTSSCTTNLARHFSAVSGESVTWDYRIYLPGYSSALVHELGIVDPADSLEQILARDLVDKDLVDRRPGSYSQALRNRRPAEPPSPVSPVP